MTNESLANLPSAEYVSAEQSSIPNISEPVPSLMLSNKMSLAPKIDEVRHSVLQTDVDLACFTETWLTDFVHDNVIQIPGYNVVRRDRLIGQHGGVCLYVKESIPFEILSQYHNDQFEILWVKARPHKLPRGLSCIIIGSIYHPLSANDRNMIDFLTEQLSLIESTYYDRGLILLGDFNNLYNCHRLNNHFSLKQLVKFPTRGRRTLDLILTNLAKFYLSIIRFGMDILLPTKTIKKRLDDPPWMTQHLKSLIQQRQKALAKGHDQLFKSLRNRVNRERKQCRSKYYDSKVSQLKVSDPKQWWKSVKYLCGMDPVNHKYDLRHLQILSSTGDETNETNEGNASLSHLANTVNQTFLEPMNTFQPLNSDHSQVLNVPGTSNQLPSTITTTESYIFEKLSSIVPTKAHGPDTIPGWLLKENADVLASPVCKILNSSYLENRLPAAWKLADVIPIPKQKPVRTVNKDLRLVNTNSLKTSRGSW